MDSLQFISLLLLLHYRLKKHSTFPKVGNYKSQLFLCSIYIFAINLMKIRSETMLKMHCNLSFLVFLLSDIDIHNRDM